jgi:hypothetical protein
MMGIQTHNLSEAGTLRQWNVFLKDRVLQKDEDMYLASLHSMMGIKL